MKKFLYKGLSLCMAANMLFSVPVYAEENSNFEDNNPVVNELADNIFNRSILTMTTESSNYDKFECSFEKFIEYMTSGDIKTDTDELKETTVYIAGDSTACEYGYDENYAIPRAGWGMYLSKFLSSKAKVVDLALGGRSSKSFTSEENYKKLFDNIKEGDFLLIQFGHNDEKDKSEEDLKTRYTNPEGDKDTEGSFKNSLYVNYILPAREKGAIPILISPVSRRKFDEYGETTDSHGLYDDAVRELAKEENVYFTDMTKITQEAYTQMNYSAEPLHALYKDPSKGLDNTHFSHFGAEYIAGLFTAAVIENDIPLSKYIVSSKDFNKTIENDFCHISRGDFIALLMRAAGFENESKDNFPDVDKNVDYSNAVGLAKEMGIALGDENGNFNPERNIKNYEIASFIMRTLRYLNYEYTPVFSPESEFANLGNWKESYDDIPKYAVQDMVDWIILEDTDLIWFYFNDEFSDKYFAQAELIKFCELLSENAEKKEQSLEDLEKVENTK